MLSFVTAISAVAPVLRAMPSSCRKISSLLGITGVLSGNWMTPSVIVVEIVPFVNTTDPVDPAVAWAYKANSDAV